MQKRRVVSVLLFNLAQPAEEIVREIIDTDLDMKFLGHYDDELELLLAIREQKADVVALPMERGNEMGLTSHLLGEFPDLVILGVNHDVTTVVLVRSCPIRRVIANCDPRTLSQEIRREVVSQCF
jgi:hypothetical protein